MLADPVVASQTGRRITWALGLSLAVHAALVILIQAQPGGAPSMAGSWTVHARIEQQAPAASDTIPAPEVSPVSAIAESKQPVAPDAAAHVAKAGRQVPAAPTKVTAGPESGPPKSAALPQGIEMPFVRDPNYYTMAALDSPPRLLGSAEVCYPQGAVGEVAYVLMISEHGSVDQATVDAIHPRGLFTGAAVELCSRLKFAPAVKDGRAVRSRVRFVVGSRPG